MSEQKFLLYPADGDIDEGEGQTQGDMAAMLVRLEYGYSLPAMLEAVKALKDCHTTMQNMALQIEQMQDMFSDDDGNIQAALEDYSDTEMKTRYALEKLK